MVLHQRDKPYNFRHKFLVKSSNVKSENYATYMVSFVGPRIWETIVVVRQNTISLEVFKENKMDSRILEIAFVELAKSMLKVLVSAI